MILISLYSLRYLFRIQSNFDSIIYQDRPFVVVVVVDVAVVVVVVLYPGFRVFSSFCL